MVVASPKINAYFDNLTKGIMAAHAVASQARAQGKDPEPAVEIQLAKNMAERVVGLISILAPQIVGSGVVERIIELEAKYGSLNWRVALQIAVEIAQEKFCKFKSKEEAIDIGIRTGFAYSTVGVVSSPLDGIVSIEFKMRNDGKGKYMCINYGGPIRNAGGTNAALSVIIADHVRKAMGYEVYDATEEETKRAYTELTDYHERVTNLQYFPHEEEIMFLMKQLPVEVSGDASEEIEVSNFKNLPRIPINQIRSGYCLILSACIPLKAPKLWKQLSQWGKDFGLEQWFFLEELISIQKKAKSKGITGQAESGKSMKFLPDYTYIADLVAGRPVLGFPLAKGGFRLRYGRSRTSGLSAQSVHPATLHVLDNYIALGTQLKVERPGKGATFSSCDLVEGPVVKLLDGSVVKVESEAIAKEIKTQIAEILFLGDVLIDYGDFANRNHVLVPAGYCEEWWALEAEKIIKENLSESSARTGISEETLAQFISEPLRNKPSIEQAVRISAMLKIPLHPKYLLHWADITFDQLKTFVSWLSTATWHEGKNIEKIVLSLKEDCKRVLEILGCPCLVPVKDTVVIEKNMAAAISFTLGAKSQEDVKRLLERIDEYKNKSVLEIINLMAPAPIRDKSGTYIGSRMGRPEKAKMRKLTGSPHGIFPVGEEGGKLRSFNFALQGGKVTADFPLRICASCKKQTVYPLCETCGTKTDQIAYCRFCGSIKENTTCSQHGQIHHFKETQIDINHYFNSALKALGMTNYPDMIKGVRGTSSKEHDTENLAKAILRAVFDVAVNKDGTVRYDCGEMAITHFKPSEIGTSVEKLKNLGYTHDITGNPLTDPSQIIEIFPQDVILPCCPDSPDEHADDFCLRVSHFVDMLLEKFYHMKPYYNINSREELIGTLIIGLAPHTSAGMVGRIIGFSKTQGFFAHPYFHQACRRDCDGDEIGFILLMDAFLNFSKKFLPSSRGSTMDAPLVLTSILIPTEVDDQAFDVGIVWNYPLELYTAALECKMPNEVKILQIKNVLNTEKQYEAMGYTHNTANINAGVLCSAYKTLPSMEEKLKGQMQLAAKIRSVDKVAVAQLVIEKHFLKDAKGNLRRFSQQEFRCVNCNEKYRRPPLAGSCLKCKGRIIFTISEGSVVKYLEPIQSIARNYGVSSYLMQVIELLSRNVESYFGREKEKQLGLGAWFG